jgi:hypothetical protein
VIDDVFQDDDSPETRNELAHTGQGGSLDTRQSSSVNVEAGDSLQDALTGLINGEVTTLLLVTGAHREETTEPLLGRQRREWPMSSHERPLEDLERLCDVETLCGFSSRSQSDVSQVPIVTEPRVERGLHTMQDWHEVFPSEGRNITVKNGS